MIQHELSKNTPIIKGRSGINVTEFTSDPALSSDPLHLIQKMNGWLTNLFLVNEHIIGPEQRSQPRRALVLPPIADEPHLEVMIEKNYRSSGASIGSLINQKRSVGISPAEPSDALEQVYRSTGLFSGQLVGTAVVCSRGSVLRQNAYGYSEDSSNPVDMTKVVSEVLTRLGYGSSEDFATASITYGEYEESRLA